MPVPGTRIRNFCIIAHIDHGKSTLADRLLQATRTIPERQMRDQILDDLDLERERGITIKSRSVRLRYTTRDGAEYQLNLIDTPGHVDFAYEVIRSMQACEGALLLVDAAQGIQAQTMANFLHAADLDLTVIPVLNKIDLPAADPDGTAAAIEGILGLPAAHCLRASAKSGQGVDAVLEAIVARIPPPAGDPEAALQALVFDAIYDSYRGIIVHFRVVNGRVRAGDRISLLRSGVDYEVTEVGRMTPRMTPEDGLAAGEVGYLTAGIKALTDIKVGDTLTLRGQRTEPLPGFREALPMVHCGLYTAGDTSYDRLRQAVERLSLNDAAFTFEPEAGGALGQGFRCGFLGVLHMEICQERLEREFDLDMVQTAPTVAYRIRFRSGETSTLTTPADLPDDGYEAIEEPMVMISFLVPVAQIGAVMTLAQERRGEFRTQEYIGGDRCVLSYRMPLAEVIYDLFDRLKTVTSGYGSMDYQLLDYQDADLVKVDVLVHHEPCPALAFISHRSVADSRGRAVIKTLKREIPQHLFEVALQAAIGSRVIARETIRALRKDVTAKCYGGDVTRKRKLLERQKRGKQRMRQVGRVTVPQTAFLAVLRSRGEAG